MAFPLLFVPVGGAFLRPEPDQMRFELECQQSAELRSEVAVVY